MPKSSSTSDVVEQDGEGGEVFTKSDNNSQSSRPVSGDLSDRSVYLSQLKNLLSFCSRSRVYKSNEISLIFLMFYNAKTII